MYFWIVIVSSQTVALTLTSPQPPLLRLVSNLRMLDCWNENLHAFWRVPLPWSQWPLSPPLARTPYVARIMKIAWIASMSHSSFYENFLFSFSSQFIHCPCFASETDLLPLLVATHPQWWDLSAKMPLPCSRMVCTLLDHHSPVAHCQQCPNA